MGSTIILLRLLRVRQLGRSYKVLYEKLFTSIINKYGAISKTFFVDVLPLVFPEEMASRMASAAEDKENAVENIGDAVRNFADEVIFSLKNR